MQIRFKTTNKIVALEGTKIVGYLTFNYPNDVANKRNLEIKFIYVSPKHRRKGIATKLVKFLIGKFKNKIVWLSFWTGIDSEKDGSWKLYPKLGFKEVVYTKDYYDKGVGTRLFIKRFKK